MLEPLPSRISAIGSDFIDLMKNVIIVLSLSNFHEYAVLAAFLNVLLKRQATWKQISKLFIKELTRLSMNIMPSVQAEVKE